MTLSLDKGHLNWYALKGLANEYHLVDLHDHSDEIVQENAILGIHCNAVMLCWCMAYPPHFRPTGRSLSLPLDEIVAHTYIRLINRSMNVPGLV